jgi:S-methylmethionine-dependent homocysteine/selenocysteine methylase
VPDSRYRHNLPQLDGSFFLTDGGLETTLIFHDGLDLPQFASFDLLKDDEGTDALRKYFRTYAKLAADNGTGFVLESPTWRANPRWGKEIGYSDEELERLNRKAIGLMEEIREEFESDEATFVISGNIGPQDDGYNPQQLLSADEAEDYHAFQINVFADTAADLVTTMTMTYADEAIGIAQAAKKAGIPSVISFTVETDGKLPNGQALGDAIGEVEAATDGAPAYYMINCAHPTHFDSVLDGPWRERVQGLRANASTRSHAELDEAEDLDDGDPQDLAARYAALRDKLPALNVVGGCCGTDHRHVTEICSAWRA